VAAEDPGELRWFGMTASLVGSGTIPWLVEHGGVDVSPAPELRFDMPVPGGKRERGKGKGAGSSGSHG